MTMTYVRFFIFAILVFPLCLQALPSDQQIARQAIIHGNNLLAANPNSQEGKKLLRVGMAILPEDEDALLALALIERGRKPKQIDTQVTLDKLIEVMISRATELAGDTSGNRQKMLQGLVFFKAAEPFKPANRDILIGLKKLERSGYTMSAEDWGNLTLTESAASPDAMANPEPGGGTVPIDAADEGKNPHEQAPADASAFRGHKYKFFAGTMPWVEARRKCEEMGGSLATIGTRDENDFVKGLAGGRRIWLGASDAEREGGWTWVRSADLWVYRNWVKTLTYSSTMSSRRRRDYDNAQTDERTLNSDAGDYLYMCPNGKWNARDGHGSWNYSSSSSSYYGYVGYPIEGYVCEWQQ